MTTAILLRGQDIKWLAVFCFVDVPDSTGAQFPRVGRAAGTGRM